MRVCLGIPEVGTPSLQRPTVCRLKFAQGVLDRHLFICTRVLGTLLLQGPGIKGLNRPGRVDGAFCMQSRIENHHR